MLHPDRPDPVYVVNGDSDDLYFIHRGGGRLVCPLGELRFEAEDYLVVPRGMLHRLIPDEGVEQVWLVMECPAGVWLPKQWRNDVGQLRMDAPFCHRDFRRPTFTGPQDEGIRDVTVKRGGTFHGLRYAESPLDVVGWDGSVYPWVFSDPQLPAPGRPGPPAARLARQLRHPRRAHLLLRAARGGLPPRGDPLSLPALVGRL